MLKKITTILLGMVLITYAFIISTAGTQENENDVLLSNLEPPNDFNLDAYCGGYAFWEDLYRVQIDSEGNGVYSIGYSEDRENAEYTEIDQFTLDQSEMNFLWDEIVNNDFFNLNEIYSESDIFPDTDIEISGGTFANIIVIGNGQEHMVETRHIGVPQFDNIMTAINTVTPGENDLFYNGLLNIPPFAPESPTGPTNGDYRQEHTYTTSAIDLDNDNLYYKFDWGDGDISEWTGPFESGEIASEKHKWSNQGDYEIKAKVIDDPNGDGDLSDGIESTWSQSLIVTMPKVKATNLVFQRLLDKFINLFPNFVYFVYLFDLSNVDIPKISLLDEAPPATEIKLDEEKCEITITIRIQIWGEGASSDLASSMETAIENLLNKDKNGNTWKIKCPKEECTKEDPGCTLKFDFIIKYAGTTRPETGEGYHVYYVEPKQSKVNNNELGGRRFVSHTMTADANHNDNIVDWPRPNDKTSNLPPPPRTPIIHNGSTVGCLHADDLVGTWAHEFLHCLGLADKYTSEWVDADGDNVRDADEVTTKPKDGHKDDIMANATKWLMQSALNLTLDRINLKCPCKCCPVDDNSTPETKIETPGNGSQVSSPIIVGGYADDGAGGSGVALLDYLLEWDGGNFDGEDYPIDPPEQYVEFNIGPIDLSNYIEEGEWITITVYATDAAANTGSDTVTVIWDEGDTTPPVTEKTIGEPNEEEGYIIWPHTPITFDATDDESGVNYIHYEVWWDSDGDGIVDTLMGSEEVYDVTLTFSVNMWGVPFGIIELRWYAVDNAGNVEDMHYQEHYVMP